VGKCRNTFAAVLFAARTETGFVVNSIRRVSMHLENEIIDLDAQELQTLASSEKGVVVGLAIGRCISPSNQMPRDSAELLKVMRVADHRACCVLILADDVTHRAYTVPADCLQKASTCVDTVVSNDDLEPPTFFSN
jgi:hypothetical protein